MARTRRRGTGRSPAARSDFDWGYFPDTRPAFPDWLTAALIEQAQLPGILGNRHASGVGIIEECAVDHLKTGKADLLHLGRQRLADRGA